MRGRRGGCNIAAVHGHKTYNLVFKFVSAVINRSPHSRSLLFEQ